jgi:hypothetical protein
MPPFLLNNLQSYLSGQQDSGLQDILGAPLTLDTYGEIITPFINTKASPDRLSSEIQTKANTEAVIMILDNNSGVIKHITNKFFLSSMQMSMREKVQIMETFGPANISFFGEAARVYVFSATTIDSSSQEKGVSAGKYYYQSSILKMYNNELRGSQLIKDNRIAVMKVSNHLIYGYPLNLQVVYNAAQDPVTNFVLQFVVNEHELSLPGIVTEEYLETMYSPYSHINTQAIQNFVSRIENILKKINEVLETSTDGEKYNSAASIKFVQNTSFSFYNYQPDSIKNDYAAALATKVAALKTEIGSSLDGEISPLVESTVPKETFERLLATIPKMFKDEETFNYVGNQLNNLIQLKKELIIFRSYRMNRKAMETTNNLTSQSVGTIDLPNSPTGIAQTGG